MGLFDVSVDIGEIASSVPWLRRLNIPKKAYLRAMLAECETNLAILRLLDLQDGAVHDAPAYLLIAGRLRSDVLASLLSGEEHAEFIFDLLKKVEFVVMEESDDSPAAVLIDSGDIGQAPPTVAEKVIGLFTAVSSLQVAAGILSTSKLSNGTEGLRNIRFRVRLRNLERAFSKIAVALRIHLEN